MKFWQVASFAEPDQLIEIAKGAEEAGFEGVLISDHLFFPGKLQSHYPYSEDGKPGFDGNTPFPDPWTTIAAMAAVTTSLRFGTMVYILPLRHPLEVAKVVGNVARMSGNRVMLGVGAGWIREEYETLGVPFKTRGKRMNEMFEVIRKAWSGRMQEHHGDHFDLAPFQMTPAPSESVPIVVGGLSGAAFKRAAALGDGWIGTGQHPDEVPGILERLRGLRAEAGRSAEPFETIVPLVVPPELDLLRKLADDGMTATTCYPFSYTIGPTSTPQQKRDAMMRFGDEVIAKL